MKRSPHGSRAPLPIPIIERLEELVRLVRGWDGEGADPPGPAALAVVRSELHRLAGTVPWAAEDVFLVPARDGSVRMEWVADNGRELTVIVGVDKRRGVEFYRYDPGCSFEEDMLARDLSRLPEMLQWLRVPERAGS